MKKLQVLQKQVEQRKQARYRKLRERYALARKLGLPYDLAQLASHKTVADIQALAKEYQETNGQEVA